MSFNPQHNPYFYQICAALGVISVLVYWQIYKRNAKLANILAFGLLFGLICYLIDWDYVLNRYFIINQWNVN